ncbi:MAG: uncharacterized protein KVP18_000304 [Porospora cf. gigantea A]|uniref:uncharacterized protein n=1 Tax=Porospora cf. gigantea A TaxID=2853593 RepID=UPI00355A5E4E|nr:MAG: hypothetical protein KVP18_000304 [Porospora cf. gigantea A]
MFDFSQAQAPLDIWGDVGGLWGCIPPGLRSEEEGLNFLQILKDMKRREPSGVKTLRTISEGASRTPHPRGGQSLGPATDRSHLETIPAPYVQRYITSPAPYLLPPSETRFPATLPPKMADTRVTMGPVMERPPVEVRASTRTVSTAVSIQEKLRFRGATMLPSLVNPGGFDVALSLHPSETIPLEALTVHEKISKGTFGTVWRGTYFTAGRRKTVAVKVAHRTESYFDQEQARSLVREIEALRRVSHPNIVSFHGVVVYEPRRYRRRRLQGREWLGESSRSSLPSGAYARCHRNRLLPQRKSF